MSKKHTRDRSYKEEIRKLADEVLRICAEESGDEHQKKLELASHLTKRVALFREPGPPGNQNRSRDINTIIDYLEIE